MEKGFNRGARARKLLYPHLSCDLWVQAAMRSDVETMDRLRWEAGQGREGGRRGWRKRGHVEKMDR